MAWSVLYCIDTEVRILNSGVLGRWYMSESKLSVRVHRGQGLGIERVERSGAPCGDYTAEGCGIEIICLHEQRVIIYF